MSWSEQEIVETDCWKNHARPKYYPKMNTTVSVENEINQHQNKQSSQDSSQD